MVCPREPLTINEYADDAVKVVTPPVAVMVVKVSNKLFADKFALASLTAMPLAAFVVLPRAVRTPVPVVVVAGAPVPPPMTSELSAKAADEVHAVLLLK